jgi:hypothetical protein
MSTSGVNGAHSHHHAEQAAQENHNEDSHASMTHEQRVVRQRTIFGRKMRAKKMAAQKMAAFFQGRKFATSENKGPQSQGAKLRQQLGRPPKPRQSGKERGKEALADDPRDDAARLPEEHHEHEHKREGEERKRDQEQGREQEQDRDRGQGQNQGDERGQSQQDSQQQNSQQQGSGQQDGRSGHEGRERREKPRKFAVKTEKAGKLKRALSQEMRTIGEQLRDSPTLAHALITASAKEVLQFTSQLEFGPLLAVPVMLAKTSPAVMKRSAARLQAHYNGTLAHGSATPGKAAATLGLIGHSLDFTLARQHHGVQYTADEQSVGRAIQLVRDAHAELQADPSKSAAQASGKAQKVRVAPVAQYGKT